MKKFLAILCIITTSITFGMEKIQVPSSRRLDENFSRCFYLVDFANHSRLAERIGGKELPVDGIELVIKTSVVNYQNEIYRKGGTVYHLYFLEKEVKDIVYAEA